MNNHKNLKFNQADISPKQYLRTPQGYIKAELVHILSSDDCGKCYEELENHYSDRQNVYRIITPIAK